MDKIKAFAIALTTACTFVAFSAHSLSPADIPRAFMDRLVAGINAHDLKALRAIIHPATLACMTPETDAYYSWWLWKDGSKRYVIAPDYQIEIRPPVDVHIFESGMPAGKSAYLHWTVQPDTGILFIYKPAPMTIMQRTFEITLKDHQARLALDCPTPTGLERFREQKKADEARQRKFAHLWHSLSGGEQEAFLLLATSGMKLDGMQAAEQILHLKPDESLAFIDMVQYADMP